MQANPTEKYLSLEWFYSYHKCNNFNIRDIRHELTRSSLFRHRKRVGKVHMIFSEFQLCATSIKRCFYRNMRAVIKKKGLQCLSMRWITSFAWILCQKIGFNFISSCMNFNIRTRRMFADELPPGCQENEDKNTPCYDFILQPIFLTFQLRQTSILMCRWHLNS